MKNIDVNFKMYSDLLKSEIGAALLPLGFRGASGRWYFEGNQVVGVLALRKSTHGKYYYLDGGFCLRSITNVTRPKPSELHLVFNAGSMNQEAAELICQALDFQYATNDLIGAAAEVIASKCARLIVSLASIERLSSMYQAGELKIPVFSWEAKKVLASHSVV